MRCVIDIVVEEENDRRNRVVGADSPQGPVDRQYEDTPC